MAESIFPCAPPEYGVKMDQARVDPARREEGRAALVPSERGAVLQTPIGYLNDEGPSEQALLLVLCRPRPPSGRAVWLLTVLRQGEQTARENIWVPER